MIPTVFPNPHRGSPSRIPCTNGLANPGCGTGRCPLREQGAGTMSAELTQGRAIEKEAKSFVKLEPTQHFTNSS